MEDTFPIPRQRLPIRIGSRGSKLALTQAETVAQALIGHYGLPADAIRIHVIRTSGDRIQDRPLREVGGKGLFTKEIEEALTSHTIDLAVHSMKDVETRLPDGLIVDCYLPRDDVRDVLLSPVAGSLAALPHGAVIGTSSLRRQAQLLRYRADFNVVMFRGNVETRLAKLEAGAVQATLLAAAGLSRLGLGAMPGERLAPEIMLPAVAQGAIGIERRADDTEMAELLAPINDPTTALCVGAERAMLARLDGSCRTPIGGLAQLADGRMRLRGDIVLPDGSAAHASDMTCAVADADAAHALGTRVAEDLLAKAGPAFLAAIAVAG